MTPFEEVTQFIDNYPDWDMKLLRSRQDSPTLWAEVLRDAKKKNLSQDALNLLHEKFNQAFMLLDMQTIKRHPRNTWWHQVAQREEDFYIANKSRRYSAGWGEWEDAGKIHIAEYSDTLCGRAVGGRNQGWTTSKPDIGMDIEAMIEREAEGLNTSDWTMCSRCVRSYNKRKTAKVAQEVKEETNSNLIKNTTSLAKSNNQRELSKQLQKDSPYILQRTQRENNSNLTSDCNQSYREGPGWPNRRKMISSFNSSNEGNRDTSKVHYCCKCLNGDAVVEGIDEKVSAKVPADCYATGTVIQYAGTAPKVRPFRGYLCFTHLEIMESDEAQLDWYPVSKREASKDKLNTIEQANHIGLSLLEYEELLEKTSQRKKADRKVLIDNKFEERPSISSDFSDKPWKILESWFLINTTDKQKILKERADKAKSLKRDGWTVYLRKFKDESEVEYWLNAYMSSEDFEIRYEKDDKTSQKKQGSKIEIYRGINEEDLVESINNGNFYSSDKSFALEFGQFVEETKIDENSILKLDPLPYGGNEKEIDDAIKIAQEEGYKAIWMEEGPEWPNSIFVIDKNALDRREIKDYQNKVSKRKQSKFRDIIVYHGTWSSNVSIMKEEGIKYLSFEKQINNIR